MATCEKSLWWYKCLHDQTLSALRKHGVSAEDSILDAGCGTGGLLEKLQAAGYKNLKGFDLSEDALEFASRNTGLNLEKCDILKAAELYNSNSFDVIISHDIICLLAEGNDELATEQLFKLLKPGGLLILNLPALSAFRGTHDLAVGITKRYTKTQVRALAGMQGNIEYLNFWPFTLSLPVYLTRLIQRRQIKEGKSYTSDVKMLHPALNEAFYRLSTFENKHIKNKPWGSSLFTIIKKSASKNLTIDSLTKNIKDGVFN
jgi:SAM-dependent methyltransferase